MSEPLEEAPTSTEAAAPSVALVEKPPTRINGRFPKGVSGNPGGRSRELEKVRRAARAHGPEAIETLVELMRSGPPKVRCVAAMALLDRGFGKPALTIDTDGKAAMVGLIILPPEDPR
jgi:hypothetical protein